MRIQLNEISCYDNSAKNYFDDQGLIYTKNSTYKNTMYLVCKNASSKNCNARARVKNNDFQNACLVQGHDHEPDQIELDRAKFSKTLEKICIDNPFEKPLKCYVQAKEELKGQISRKHIDMHSFYGSFIHRKQKLTVPLHPSTIGIFKFTFVTSMNDS